MAKTRKTRAQKQRIQERRKSAKPAVAKETPARAPAAKTTAKKVIRKPVAVKTAATAGVVQGHRPLRLSLIAFAVLAGLQLLLWGATASGVIDLSGLLNSIQL